MLGEEHTLAHDFPEHQDVIVQLSKSDELFAKDNKHYTSLDKEIRGLELRNSPIDDLEMQKLKHQRSMLKDSLYKRMTAAMN